MNSNIAEVDEKRHNCTEAEEHPVVAVQGTATGVAVGPVSGTAAPLTCLQLGNVLKFDYRKNRRIMFFIYNNISVVYYSLIKTRIEGKLSPPYKTE